MWLLVTTLCLQMDASAAECRREVRGPYSQPMDCREMMIPTYEYLQQQATDIGARSQIITVTCERGTDT